MTDRHYYSELKTVADGNTITERLSEMKLDGDRHEMKRAPARDEKDTWHQIQWYNRRKRCIIGRDENRHTSVSSQQPMKGQAMPIPLDCRWDSFFLIAENEVPRGRSVQPNSGPRVWESVYLMPYKFTATN